MNYKDLLEKKRLGKDEKDYLIREIVKSAIKLLNDEGVFIKVRNLESRPISVKKGNMEVMYTTPFNKLEDVNYLLDIWLKGSGKVLSLQWDTYVDHQDNPNEIDIIGFKKGDWVRSLIEQTL